MLAQSVTPHQIVGALVLVALGIVLGFTARAALRSATAKGKRLGPAGTTSVVVVALDRTTVAWSAAAGVYGAAVALPLTPRARAAVSELLVAFVIVTATVAAARIAGGVAQLYATRLPGSSSIFANVARVTVFVLGGLVLLRSLGVSIAPLLTALGVGGLAVALALQDTLSNLFAGLQILASKKVVPGDYVQLDSGEEGYVVDINWRNTSLRHLRNNVILVPNARLASATVTNYYKPFPEMSVLVGVGVSYRSDLPHVERITTDVARQTLEEVEGGVPDFEPFIRYGGFGESSIDFTVILRVSEPTAQYLVTHEFVKRLHERFGREGIEIPFPIRTIVFKDGERPRGESPRIGDERDGRDARLQRPGAAINRGAERFPPGAEA